MIPYYLLLNYCKLFQLIRPCFLLGSKWLNVHCDFMCVAVFVYVSYCKFLIMCLSAPEERAILPFLHTGTLFCPYFACLCVCVDTQCIVIAFYLCSISFQHLHRWVKFSTEILLYTCVKPYLSHHMNHIGCLCVCASALVPVGCIFCIYKSRAIFSPEKAVVMSALVSSVTSGDW